MKNSIYNYLFFIIYCYYHLLFTKLLFEEAHLELKEGEIQLTFLSEISTYSNMTFDLCELNIRVDRIVAGPFTPNNRC